MVLAWALTVVVALAAVVAFGMKISAVLFGGSPGFM
jgi:hypothetical protein